MSSDNRRRTSRPSRKERSPRIVLKRPRKRRGRVTSKSSHDESARTKVPASYLFTICFVVALVAGAFVFHLHIRFEGVRLGYETSGARAQRARLLVESRELRLELASLKAPERVEAEAREKLGMEMPDHRRIIPIGKKRRSVVASGGAR